MPLVPDKDNSFYPSSTSLILVPPWPCTHLPLQVPISGSLTDITDAKKDSSECSYLRAGQGRITRQLLCLLAYFHSKSRFRLQDNPCPNKKSLGISTAFVKAGQADKIFFIFTYNVLKISRLPPTFAISSDFCIFSGHSDPCPDRKHASCGCDRSLRHFRFPV